MKRSTGHRPRRVNRRTYKKLKRMVYRNPVLVLGLGLPFAIVSTTSLKNGVALSIAMFLVNIPVMLAASLIGKKAPLWLRTSLYVLLATGLTAASRYIVIFLFPDIMNFLGIYLWLMAVNTVTLSRAETTGRTLTPVSALADGFVSAAGFSVVVLILSLVRELFGNGTIWGISTGIPLKLGGLLLPFAGFILVGFFMAIYQAHAWWRYRVKQRKYIRS